MNQPAEVTTISMFCDADKRTKQDYGRGESLKKRYVILAEFRLWGSAHVSWSTTVSRRV